MPDVAATGMLLADDLRDDEAFPSLLRALRRADGFELLIAVCNEPARRAGLMDRIDASLGTSALRIAVPADCDDALAVVEAALRAAPAPPGAVMVVGLGNGIRSTAPEHPRLRALNHRREEWAEVLHVPVVLWIPEYLLGPLARQAPDFLDWRSGTFLFLPPLGIGGFDRRPAPAIPTERWRLTETERRARMAQLREWLGSLPPAADGHLDATAVRWKLELAAHHFDLGEIDDCLRIARDEVLPFLAQDDAANRARTWDLIALVLLLRGQRCEVEHILRDVVLPLSEHMGDPCARPIVVGRIADLAWRRGEPDEAIRLYFDESLKEFQRLGALREAATTWVRIADVHRDQGRLDDAERILLDDALPIFERLGDETSRALVMGRVADIHEYRGEFDDALRIHRGEVLPIVERTGDVRARAVVLGKIASVLKAQGNLDESLRIHVEEELPVYERLGDLRERAVTLGEIADILQAKGLLDDAMRIHREVELPAYERMQDVWLVAMARAKIANILQLKGDLDAAIRMRQESVIPAFERLGARRSLLVAKTWQGMNLAIRGAPGDRAEAIRLLATARAEAEQMRIPEAEQIRCIQANIGLETGEAITQP